LRAHAAARPMAGMGELAAGEPPVMFPVMLPPVYRGVSGRSDGCRAGRYGRLNARSDDP
jgi:hypothetical protein